MYVYSNSCYDSAIIALFYLSIEKFNIHNKILLIFFKCSKKLILSFSAQVRLKLISSNFFNGTLLHLTSQLNFTFDNRK